jgi:hypothetical protein
MKKKSVKRLIIRSRGNTSYKGTHFMQYNGLLSKHPRKFGSLSFRKRKYHKVWFDYLCKSFDAGYHDPERLDHENIANAFNRHTILGEKIKDAEKYVKENFVKLWEKQYKRVYRRMASRPVIIKIEMDFIEKIQAYQSVDERNMQALAMALYPMSAVFPKNISWINIDRFLKEKTAPFQIDKEGSNQELAASIFFRSINSVLTCKQTNKRIEGMIPVNRTAVVILMKYDKDKNILTASKTVKANEKLKLSDFVFAPLKKKDLKPTMAQNQTDKKNTGEPEPKP